MAEAEGLRAPGLFPCRKEMTAFSPAGSFSLSGQGFRPFPAQRTALGGMLPAAVLFCP